jgi:hypothetical protein
MTGRMDEGFVGMDGTAFSDRTHECALKICVEVR